MKKEYDSSSLYTAVVNKLYQVSKEKKGIFVTRTYVPGMDKHIVVIKDNDGIYDIRHPEINLLEEVNVANKMAISVPKPLYNDSVHKVVSVRRAYIDMTVKRIKKVVCK